MRPLVVAGRPTRERSVERAPAGEIVEVADGVRALRVNRATILPPRLDQLLERLAHQRSRTVRLFATSRAACVEGEHERVPWVTGVYLGRELRLDVCPYCRGVEVRDVSLDMLPGLRPGASGPRRRDDVLGWYSGRRPAGRAFM